MNCERIYPFSLPSLVFTLMVVCSGLTGTSIAQKSKLETAMEIKPKHRNEVDYEQPGVAVLKDCKFAQTKSPSGFVVHHIGGRILRRFIDTNGDGKLDQWSYFKDGLEVYRDVDSNKDGKLDQYRWMGPAGTRWGLDPNQDGVIDQWKVISPEEIAYECFQAIKSKDQPRFTRLLLSERELASLQLNDRIGGDIKSRWQRAQRGFAQFAMAQKTITQNSKWIYAGNGQPAMMASGDGNKNDLLVYDHASGFFQNGKDTRQLALGSIVQIGQSWRMVEMPEIVDAKKPLGNGGGFFPIAEFGSGTAINSPVDRELSDLFAKLAKVEEEIEKAPQSRIEKLQKQKADTLTLIYSRTKEPKAKLDWIKNLADSVASAYQNDKFQDGVDYLNDFIRKNSKAAGVDYVKWRAIFAEYGWFDKNADAERKDAARKKLMAELTAFQKTFPSSDFAPDALIQLAVNAEVASTDEPDKAIEWYKVCAQRYPNTVFGRRAKGALVRLGSFGKTFPFRSKTSTGQPFDLASLKGKMVVLHFWETWCLQDEEIELLAKIAKKYEDDLVVVGCNVESGDDATDAFGKFLKANNRLMTWRQLHEPGGVDGSPLAHQLGLSLEPLLVLVDKEGKLVESNIAIGDLEREIERERRRR